jgi:hypothetical protein
MKEHMKLLGLTVKDCVTGFSGVVTTVGFDLYGCVQAVVTPVAQDSKLEESRWFDTNRLEVTNETPVMEVPDFQTVPGGAEKSLPERY